MNSLGDALPAEMIRVREILWHYKEIGVAGVLGAAMIEKSLHNADKAVISGDVSEMVVAYKDLQEITG